MKCPFCAHPDDKVVDSRTIREGELIRRRRECLSCTKRFTTYERIEEIPLMVAKKDGRREPFDRSKIVIGVLKACEKRPVAVDQIEELVDRIEKSINSSMEKEVSSETIGAMVMEELRSLDEVAYVRFASVYRQFKDIDEFMDVVKTLYRHEKT
ncbi:MAG: transcriptional repressor NrdR [Candidatus Abyssobacteria bacterium SURF_17]|uniref:Transcriptional repressor NrdR n=1 Tax=Candidatus Abyssobacteria bacterium SURF_17 TaxID=2093361 RepID=A0A419F8F4_9BACT|nr:MAG: transcriptional repressor NrdR [Candidatus Abyssubacteria bacterium SURF_17]